MRLPQVFLLMLTSMAWLRPGRGRKAGGRKKPGLRLLGSLCVHFLEYLPDGAGELFGQLGAGYRVFLREHVGRHAGNTLVGGFLGLPRNQGDVLVGGKALANVVGIAAAIGG